MIKWLCLLIILFLPLLGFAQQAKPRYVSCDTNGKVGDKWWFMACYGLSYQKQLMGEAGLKYETDLGGGLDDPGSLMLLSGPKIATEFNFNFNHFFLGPKISYEADVQMFGLRVNFIDYTNFKQNDFRFTPEIGLSVISVLDLFYGYNIPLNANAERLAGTNRITLDFCIGYREYHQK